MDYIDPVKAARHQKLLFVGYVCIGIAIFIAALVLVYQAYGFGIGKNGKVIQNGLVFFSSQPSPADIFLNGKRYKAQTDTRAVLPEGVYHSSIHRTGYRDWQRTIEVEGGSVRHFDYPFLVPTNLVTKKVAAYPAAPPLESQSPDRRWLLVARSGAAGSFDLYDLKAKPVKPPVKVTIPAAILSYGTGGENLAVGEWSDDNRHVLLQHSFDGKTEFIMLDRQAPDQSVNLNTALSANPAQLVLRDKKYDQYYVLTQADGQLQTASLSAPTLAPVLQHVVAFKAYKSDTLLYASSDALPGTVVVKLRSGGTQDFTIRSLPANSAYLLDVASYSSSLYVAAGATNSGKVYVYRDPIGQLSNLPNQPPTPLTVLKVPQPNRLSFSITAQFVSVENGQQFSVYDIENKDQYQYSTAQPLDAPQTYATWMDGDRLTYVSGGQQIIFDYDYANRQAIGPAAPAYLPAFSPNFQRLYTLSTATSPSQFALKQTDLLIPSDQ